MSLSIISFNTRGAFIVNPLYRCTLSKFAAYVNRQPEVSVLALSEFKFGYGGENLRFLLDSLNDTWEVYQPFNYSGSQHPRAAVNITLVKVGVAKKVERIPLANDTGFAGLYVFCKIETSVEKPLYLLNLHIMPLPSNNTPRAYRFDRQLKRQQFWASILQCAAEYNKEQKLIIAGDFNADDTNENLKLLKELMRDTRGNNPIVTFIAPSGDACEIDHVYSNVDTTTSPVMEPLMSGYSDHVMLRSEVELG